MKTFKIKYEQEDDVLNIWLSKKLYDYAEDENGVITHYTKKGEPVYIEILDASRFLKRTKTIPIKTNKDVISQSPVAHRIK